VTERTRFKAFITLHALTVGIQEVEVEDCFDSPTVVKAVEGYPEYYRGREWHRSREEAIARAENMRSDRIASLKKQIKKREEQIKRLEKRTIRFRTPFPQTTASSD